MTVTVHMHGNLRRFMPDGRDRMVMEVGAGTTIETFLASLGAERDTWLVAVNGKAAEMDCVLAPSDQLDCFEPVAGG
jgi:sulfur carrier protein ThiS